MGDPVNIGDVIDNRYALRRELSRSAYSIVFEADQLFTTRTVALKLSRHEPERLLEQAAVLGSLRHRCIVDVYDAGTLAGGEAYLAMERVVGVSLDGALAVRGRLSVDETVSIGLALCDALGSAHGQGLAHGDLCERHVLVPRGEGAAMLIDMRRRFDPADGPRETASHNVREVEHDLRALGALLHACLTGAHAPAPADGGPAGDLRDLRPDTPNPLVDAIMRGLEPGETGGFENARDFGRALERACPSTRITMPPFSEAPAAMMPALAYSTKSEPVFEPLPASEPRPAAGGAAAATIVNDKGLQTENERHRRDRLRYAVDLDVTLDSAHNFYAALATNLSADGVFVSTHILQPIGMRCQLTIHVPGRAKPIKGVGEVRWVRGRTGPEEAPPGMGLQFVELEPGDRDLVEAFLRQREPLVHRETDD